MSRGRKAKASNTAFSWEQIANKNVGKYLQYIISELSKVDNHQTETGADLLKKIKAEKLRLIKDKKLKKGIELATIKLHEIPFAISKSWVWCRLGEIGICQTGTTPSTFIKEYFGNDIPFIKPADITLKGLICDNEGLSFSGLKQGVLIPKNSLMMVCIGGSIGKSYHTHIDVSCNQQINTITPLAGISAQFLQFLTQSEYFQKAIWLKASGGTTPIVNRSKWESILIPLPSLKEQEKIVNFLTDFENDNLKEEGFYFNPEVEQKVITLHESQLKGAEIANELNHQRTLLKQLRQQLLQDAVQGKLVDNTEGVDETGSQLLQRIQKEKAQLIKDKKLKKDKDLPPIKAEDVPFDIPHNWVWCRLGEICTKITDGFHNTPPKVLEGVPYISATHVKSDNIDWEGCNYVAENFHRELFVKAYPSKGELLVVNIGAGCGTPAIINVDYEFSFKNTAILKFNQELISNRLLYYYFLLKKDEIYITLTKGGLQPFLSLKILNEIYFPLPPLSIQQKIVSKVGDLMRLCDALEASIQASVSQNEALLQQVLREALGS